MDKTEIAWSAGLFDGVLNKILEQEETLIALEDAWVKKQSE